MLTIFDVKGIGPTTGTGLTEKGITTAEQLAKAEIAVLLTVSGIGEARAEQLIQAAKAALVPAPVSDIAAAPVKAPVPAAAAPEAPDATIKADKKKAEKAKKDKKKNAKPAKAKKAEKSKKADKDKKSKKSKKDAKKDVKAKKDAKPSKKAKAKKKKK
ncbi:helix-hairpin-helix domain-containing protein [uncultured Sneathiella sp.]|uniref:helix-hairpin-helix domain-containing protein n=1 Tax=uncultured Sneathiella sp. TaxID=879315 RepID=UPI0030ECD69D|tara:strand:+ start:4997 stop:5470 length:474 start_codon:yes stop_codon:yes gene_type:complete